MAQENSTASSDSAGRTILITDPTYYETLYQIVQDAQAAGSVVQIVTIFPISVGGLAPGDAVPMDCMPSGKCPK